MRRPLKDGKSYREHLEIAAQRGNATAIAELEGPEVPEALEYLWRWWQELDSGRRVGAHGFERITWLDVQAWMVTMDRRPEPHEVRALMVLDATVLHPPDGPEKD